MHFSWQNLGLFSVMAAKKLTKQFKMVFFGENLVFKGLS